MNDNTTNATPAENGGEKIFTQSEVNDIIRERLARERAKSEPSPLDEREQALNEREAALKARESRAACEDYLKEMGIAGKRWPMFLDTLDTNDVDRFKKIVDVLGAPYIPTITTTGANTPNPPTNSGRSSDAELQKAFAPKI